MDAERRGQPQRWSTARSVPLVEHRAPAGPGQPDGGRELVIACMRPAPVDAEQGMAEAAGAAIARPGRWRSLVGEAVPGAARPSPTAEGALTERVDVVEQAARPANVRGHPIVDPGEGIPVVAVLIVIVIVIVIR